MNIEIFQGSEVDFDQSLLQGDNESDIKFKKFILEGKLS
jgi:hypothetical protein